MRKVAVVVEGQGDADAIPSLIARISAQMGCHAVACDPPIRAGEAHRLRRAGELERILEMASSRDDAEEVIVVLDLDDDCPAQFSAEFTARSVEISERFGKSIKFCFCIREFESWLLASIDEIRTALPEYGWDPEVTYPNSSEIRGAKEEIRRISRLKGYKQTRDQIVLSRKIDLKKLAVADRSFRKFVKVVSGYCYDDILSYCARACPQLADSQAGL